MRRSEYKQSIFISVCINNLKNKQKKMMRNKKWSCYRHKQETLLFTLTVHLKYSAVINLIPGSSVASYSSLTRYLRAKRKLQIENIIEAKLIVYHSLESFAWMGKRTGFVSHPKHLYPTIIAIKAFEKLLVSSLVISGISFSGRILMEQSRHLVDSKSISQR